MGCSLIYLVIDFVLFPIVVCTPLSIVIVVYMVKVCMPQQVWQLVVITFSWLILCDVIIVKNSLWTNTINRHVPPLFS